MSSSTQNFVGSDFLMLNSKFKDKHTSVSRDEGFKGFYHILAWWPSWSCDQDYFQKIMSPLLKKAPHKNNFMEGSGSDTIK